MATYNIQYNNDTNLYVLSLKEQMLYGSDLLGVYNDSIVIGFSNYIKFNPDNHLEVIGPIGMLHVLDEQQSYLDTNYFATMHKYHGFTGKIQYGLKNHLGNVHTTISDKPLLKDVTGDGLADEKRAIILSSGDYYPFGMLKPGRNFYAKNYRFGYNSQEKDDEITGVTGSHLDFGERIYDSRLGRFLSVDKLTSSYPWWSPYAFAGNTPIQAIDLDGLEIYYAQSGEKIGTYGTSTDIRVINADAVVTFTTEFAAYTNAQQTNPAATNEYMGSAQATTNSVAFADYFTTVADVTNDAALDTYTNNGKNCYTAARKQCTNEGVTPSGPDDAINTMVATNSNLTADPIGGAIYTQTELNAGNPVMVGVKETKTNGTVSNSGNTNSLTGHFVVIRSSNVAAYGTVTFNYLDNASTALGKNANNNFTLDTSTGAMTDTSVPARSNYQRYDVSEVRTND